MPCTFQIFEYRPRPLVLCGNGKERKYKTLFLSLTATLEHYLKSVSLGEVCVIFGS